MPIHPSVNHYEDTLANAIMYYYKSMNEPFTFRCINRIDRDTSGLTILAKNLISSSILYNAIKNHKIKRTYLAFVEGSFENNYGTINSPIGRVYGSTIEREINNESGEEAITHYKVLGYSTTHNFSLIELSLETGRTHQIRVHMKSIGHPLLGDFLYNPSNSMLKRQALHSYSLALMHPITEENIIFTAPLPEDMLSLLNKLDNNSILPSQEISPSYH